MWYNNIEFILFEIPECMKHSQEIQYFVTLQDYADFLTFRLVDQIVLGMHPAALGVILDEIEEYLICFRSY